MRLRLILGWLVVLSLVAAIGYAQQPPVRPLSLAEALDIARRNNPDYLTVLNDRWGASATARSSFFNLLPTVSASASQRWTQEGTTVITGIPTPITSPTSTYSSWGLSASYTLSGSVIAGRGFATSNARATDADISGALRTLETAVRSQYLSVLQAQAQAALAQRSLERVQENLNLARARYAVGQGTLIDVRRAEVDLGTAEVNLLTANQAVDNQTLALFQALGVPAPEPVQLQLTDSFPVTRPALVEDSLIQLALAENPGLQALRARAASARWNTRAAVSQYLPSFQLAAGLGSFRQFVDSNTTSNQAAHTTSGKNPLFLYVGVSLPLWDGLARAAQIQQARSLEDDNVHAIRARELAVRANVAAAWRALVADYRKIELQQNSKAAAAEALDLATQRYRVGSGSYLELLDARLAADRADADYISAVYGYHRAIATLEQAVGRPLR